MEPPQAPATTTVTTTTPSTLPTPATTTSYPDSLDSSPRSRATDFDDPSFPSSTTTTTTNGVGGGVGKLRLMCSYGGHIVPRPHDKSLCYVGGDTRIVVVERSTSLHDLLTRLSKTLMNNRPFTLKYQLPTEDLDSLITVSSEEDLDNMVDEYDRLNAGNSNHKPTRIRLFLFPAKQEGVGSIGSILDGSGRSEDWFLNALNGSGAAGIQRGFSDPTASVNCLLGLEENGGNFVNNSNNSDSNINNNNCSAKEMVMEGGAAVNHEGKLGNKLGNQNQSNPDIQSVPDSPIIETTSSFGSTSSSPSLANLPPIRVHVDDVAQQRVVGIEEQFAQMGIGVQNHQKQGGEEVGFVVLSSPPNTLPPVTSSQPVIGQQPVMMTSAPPQQKQQELPSPDSVSSDSSLSNAISRQKQVIYQDPSAAPPQMSSGSNRFPANFVDPNAARIQMQQITETGYTLASQYEQHQQQQMLQQPQPPQSQQPQAQPQQYIPAGPHFVHHPAGAVPLSTYYPMYQPQQAHHHHPHQYPVYYVQAPGQPPQAYSLPVQQQPNMGEPVNATRPQNPPNPSIITTSSAYNPNRNVPSQKAEMPPGVYRTAAPGGPQLVQVPSSQPQPQNSQAQPQSQPPPQQQQQQQFVGYSQIHHQSQSNSAANGGGGGYAYEYADPSHAQIYYTQPLAPTMAAQYQAVTSGATMVMSDCSSQLPNDNLKQQIRSSQQL